MDQRTQEAMDGSPAKVLVALDEVRLRGKFGWANQGAVLSEGFRLDVAVIAIQFQCGPIGEVGVNGCSIEDVIDVLIARLQGFQAGKFKCRENALAITKLEEAKLWLFSRTIERQRQGVEGTNAPHTAP